MMGDDMEEATDIEVGPVPPLARAVTIRGIMHVATSPL
jgi:hypothetical protein